MDRVRRSRTGKVETGAEPGPAPAATWKFDDHLTWSAAASLTVALVLAAYWRVPSAGRALLFGDEFHSLRRIGFGYRFLLTDFCPAGSGMTLPLLQRMLSDAFGLNHWTIRAPALVSGLAMVASMYPLGGRMVGGYAALVATFFAASSSMLIYYSHFGRAYSMMVWFSLMLVYSLQRILESNRPAPRYYAYCLALVAALPYVHLSSLAFVLAVVGATLLPLWVGARKQEALLLAGALITGLTVAGLAHAPAFASMSMFVSDKTSHAYFGDFGFWDVAALLTGGRGAAILLLPVLLFALARVGHRGGWKALPLAAACLSPGIALIVVRPYGDAYAYSRYAITALPFVFLVLGWLLSDLFGERRRVEAPKASRLGRGRVLIAGVLIAGASFLAGPKGLRAIDDGAFANTYLTLLPLPAFDAPWHGMPPFYRSLGENPAELRIIEVPALLNRSRHLYRNYFLQHGVETWLGMLPEELEGIPDGPYVSFDDPDWRGKSDADYVIVHFHINDELRDYWDFVYTGRAEEAERPDVFAYMVRHSRYGPAVTAGLAELASKLTLEVGEPVYHSGRIAVWDLRGGA